MKTAKFSIAAILTLFFSGCVIFSFYPLYNEKDLFVNNILTGNWVDEDSTQWNFSHPYKGKEIPGNIDSTSYVLEMIGKDQQSKEKEVFLVHIIKLDGNYFLDFYLKDFYDDKEELADFHVLPIHTFAKLTIKQKTMQINWFNYDWLADIIEKNELKIRHENNGETILLTAKPKELQKFVKKYANTEEAFKDALEVVLTRN
jgi:hypothetical protein